MDELFVKIQKLIAEKLGIDESKVTMDAIYVKCKIGGFKPLDSVCLVPMISTFFVRIIQWVLKVFFIQRKV